MALKFLGALTISPAVPQLLTSVTAIAAAGRGKSFAAIGIAQKRGNVGFVFVGDSAMSGEADASFTIPPASATAAPFAWIPPNAVQQNAFGIEGTKVDGTAAETVQVFGLEL